MSADEPSPMPHSVLQVLHVEKHSGPQRSLEPRLEHLAALGARVTTLVPEEGPAVARARSLGEVVTGVPGALLVPRSPLGIARMAGAIRCQAEKVEDVAAQVGADLVVVTSARMPGALSGARRAGVASLLYEGEFLSGPLLHRLMGEPVGRYARRSAGAIVVPSRLVARWYEDRGGHPYVVNPAVSLIVDDAAQRRGEALRMDLGLAPNHRLVCTLGAITRGRGQDVLVRALAQGRAKGEGWDLVIGGEAYARPSDIRFHEELRRLPAELGVADAVTFAGRVDDPAALLCAADVFVNPARVPESFGRAACEALLASCPVVTTRVGGVEEALRDGQTALFAEPEDAGALADAISTLLSDPGLAQSIARNGKEDIQARFAPSMGNPLFETAVRAAMEARG